MADESKKILIVEDETPLREALREKLTREGFSVFRAKNGEEGLQIALREHPALILLDVIMPKIDGVTMLRSLREDEEYGKKVPVIILTNVASASEQIEEDINELDPTAYLVKSDSKLEDIITKIREVLERGDN